MKHTKPPIGHSYSDDYMTHRDQSVPAVSSLMTHGISQYRKDRLSNEVASGFYREGSGPKFNETGITKNSIVSPGAPGKFAQQSPGGGAGYQGSGYGGGFGDTLMQMPEIYSPLWLTSNLNLPRDRATINAWCRAFFALNPFVHNAIQLHSTYPISKLSIKCPNPKAQDLFDQVAEELDLINICVQIAQEYWLLGEAFPYAEFDKKRMMWSRIMLYNPDYMIVKRTVIPDEPVIMLRPDENLRRVVNSNRAGDIEQRKHLEPYIINAVKRGENIQVPNFNCTHLARKISPYEIRGTGLPVCVFRDLMLYDKLTEAKFAQADGMINPLTLIKIGSNAPEGLHPTHGDLEAWRAVFEQAASNKNFNVFTHPDVAVERIGYGQGIYDTSGDFTLRIKNIFIGLQVPSVIMDGADVTYANGGVALDVLRSRYLSFRNMLASYLKNKIFRPIAEIHGLYNVKNGKKELIVPDVEWNHMSLFDANDYISNLVQLTTSGGEQGPPARVSLHTLYRSLGLEWEDEQRKMKQEAIAAEILHKEIEALKAMTLTEVRSLDEDEDIPEATAAGGQEQQQTGGEAPVPGEMPSGGGAPLMPDTGSLPGLPSSPPAPPPEAPPPAPSK